MSTQPVPSEGGSPKRRPVKGSPVEQEGRCNHPLKNAPGRFCPRYPVKGRTRCRTHGGATLVGIAHPAFKTGAHMRPRYRVHGKMGEAYERHLMDPEYMALNHELALVTAQVDITAEQLSQLRPLEPEEYEENGPCNLCGFGMTQHPVDVLDPRLDPPNVKCPTHRPRVVAGFDVATRAQRLTEITEMQVQLHHQLEQRRKLTETEIYRVKTAQESLSTDTARLFGHAVLVALREECGDLQLVGRVQARTLLILRGMGLNVPGAMAGG